VALWGLRFGNHFIKFWAMLDVLDGGSYNWMELAI